MSRAHRGYVKHAALLLAAAFIALPAFAATLTVTTLNDVGVVSGDGSLRGEIEAAAAGDTIVFQPGLTGTITLTGGSLTISQSLTIQGPTASMIAVNGNNNFQVFRILISSVTAFISNLTIENGHSATGGGGIENFGTLTVTNSTISGNNGGSLGGGIFNEGTLTVINSTIANNIASSGGGIYNSGDLTVTNSTISGNSASDAGGIFGGPNSTTLKSTILATNGVGGNCAGPGTISSAGYNLSDDATCTSFTQTGDLNSTPAGLASNVPLNNGGPTPTIALLLTSPAVDAIPPSACTDQSTPPVPVTIDQRYVMRPQGPGCDIGAFELVIPGAFQVRYVAHLDIGDSIINITNDGLYSSNYGGTSGIATGNGNLCIGVYAFDPNEELQSCCSCLVTPDGLVSLSAKAINAASLTGENPTSLVIKLLSWATTAGASSTATPGTPAPPTSSACNAGSPGPAGPTAGMHAWGTSLHPLPATGYSTTETPFSKAILSTAEFLHITQFCQYNQINGSGNFGQCPGCTVGGQ